MLQLVPDYARYSLPAPQPYFLYKVPKFHAPMIAVREFTLKKALSQVHVTIDYKKDFSKKPVTFT
jgi:hypothetical protein